MVGTVILIVFFSIHGHWFQEIPDNRSTLKFPSGIFRNFKCLSFYWSLIVHIHVKLTIFEFDFHTSMNCEISEQYNTSYKPASLISLFST